MDYMCSQQKAPNIPSAYLNAHPCIKKSALKDESNISNRNAVFGAMVESETQSHSDHTVPLRSLPRASSDRLAHMGLKASASSLEMLHPSTHR